MNSLQRRYLKQIGIPVWNLRRETSRRGRERERDDGERAPGREVATAELDSAVATASVAGVVGVAGAVVVAGEARVSGGPVEAADDWTALRSEVRGCIRCALHSGRTQTVFGVGRQNASLMIVGEAPGAEEDRQGEPFVGPAGQLLNAMLHAIGFAREDVFIANILKCRPPHNRDPGREEIMACSGYLERQIALVRPQAMLAVGRIAAQWLLQSDMPIGRLRGAIHRYGERDVPLVVTYHPAYLLRSPLAKAKSWQDLCKVKDLVTAGPETTE